MPWVPVTVAPAALLAVGLVFCLSGDIHDPHHGETVAVVLADPPRNLSMDRPAFDGERPKALRVARFRSRAHIRAAIRR